MKPGKHRCGLIASIAWVPTMARPRMLDAFYNQSVTLSQVDAVVVVVVNVGKPSPALNALDLLMANGSYVSVFKANAQSPQPACMAANVYAVPASLRAGPFSAQRVVAVRLTPSQARVARKLDLIQVC